MASLLNFFIEIIIMIWEIVLNRKMRKYKIEGFEKINEEDRRTKYGKKFGACGCMTFAIYILVIIFGMFAFESRNAALEEQLD
jgi:SNF family Na+-dependent transporter